MNKNPLLSIIIPIYNVEKYIGECLDSIFKQIGIGSHSVEIIIVNDGTPDNSMNVVMQFVDKYPNSVKVINQANQGLSMARNNGLLNATGEYVWFVDSDDYILPNAISDIYQAINDYPDNELFSSYLLRYYETDHSMKQEKHADKTDWLGKDYLWSKETIGASVRYIYKRSFLTKNSIEFVPNILHEDGIWGYQCLYLAKSLHIIESSLYVYRIRRGQSIMSSVGIRSAYDLMKSYTLLKEFQMKKVAKEDQKKFSVAIFGIVYSLLDFCKNLYKDKAYKEFLNYNRTLIKKDAWKVFVHNFLEINALLIAIRPELFSYLLRCRQKIINYGKG